MENPVKNLVKFIWLHHYFLQECAFKFQLFLHHLSMLLICEWSFSIVF